MRQFTKAVCVLDTCSIINLDEIILNKRDILVHLRKCFDVHVSDRIVGEFGRHRNKLTSSEANYWNRFLRSSVHQPAPLIDDAAVLSPFYSQVPVFGADSAGERGNIRVALELLLTRKCGHAIFITDDDNALNAFIHNVRRSFPGVTIWTSVDVVMYLGGILMRERRATYEEVRAALRDVYAAGASKWTTLAEPQKSAFIQKQAKSIESLRRLKHVTDHWN